MLLKTKRLTIRRITDSDWQAVKAIWMDFNTSAYARFDRPHETDDEAVRARIARWAQTAAGMEHMFYAVCLEGTVIGYIACNIRENGYELGYCFHSAYHGRGYAKESHQALLSYLRQLGIRRFTAGTALENTPSVSLLRALGFAQTETEPVSFYQDADGNDMVFDGGIFELAL